MAQQQKNQPQSEEKGSMTVEEAGRMGGQRVREVVEEGKQQEQGSGGSSGRSEQQKQQQQGGSKNR